MSIKNYVINLKGVRWMYNETIQIQIQARDYQGNLKIGDLFSMMSDVATNHALELGIYDPIVHKSYGWVVSKIKIEFLESLKDLNEIRIETTPNQGTNVSFPRSFYLYHQDTLVGKAISYWSLLDLNKRRIAIPKRLGIRFPEDLPSTDMVIEETMQEGEFEFKERREVRYSEVDVNGHLNNAHYMMWALDCLPPDFFEKETIKTLVVFFKKETALHETLNLTMSQKEHDYIISGSDDNGELHFQVQLKTAHLK